MKKILKAMTSFLLAVCLVAGTLPSPVAEAAKKPALSRKSVTIKMGASYNLSVKNAGKSKIKWYTSKKSIAAIKASGSKVTIKGMKPGKATVSAKIGKKTYKCSVKVVAAPKINKTSLILAVGEAYNLKVTGTTSKPKFSVKSSKYLSGKKTGSFTYRITAKKVTKTTYAYAKVNGKTLKVKVRVVKRGTPNTTPKLEALQNRPKPTPPAQPAPSKPAPPPVTHPQTERPATPSKPAPPKPVTPPVTQPETERPVTPPTERPTEKPADIKVESITVSNIIGDDLGEMVVGESEKIIVSDIQPVTATNKKILF